MTCLVLSERTLLRLLVLLLLRRSFAIIAVEACMPLIQRILERIDVYLRGRGLAHDLLSERPDYLAAQGYNVLVDLRRLTNVFMEREEQLSRHFDFDDAERRYGRYSYAYRHLCCNAMLNRYPLLYTVRDLTNEGLGPVEGLNEEHTGLYRAIFDAAPNVRPVGHVTGWMLNFSLAFAAASVTTLFVVRRLKFGNPAPKRVFLASDFVNDPRDQILWDEVTTSPDEILIVCRNRRMLKDCRRNLPRSPSCTLSDGSFSFTTAAVTWTGAIKDIAKLFAAGSHLAPSTFYRLISLPYARVRVRGFLGSYAPRFFWARDDYNSDHIVRTDEFRRAGIVSVSMMHGIPILSPLVEPLRYIDFDIYYVFGIDQYERYYKRRWPAHMQVKAVGCFSLTRSELQSLSVRGQRDIAVFLEPNFFIEKIFDAIRRVALAFPDRKVYINVKFNRRIGPYGERLAAFLRKAPPNVYQHTDRAYDLFWKCGYTIVDGSTLGFEAIQFGLAAFHLDLDTRWKALYCRDFPALCVASADELVDRILKIESGGRYPREEFSMAIDLSGQIIWDVIRADLGLPIYHDSKRSRFA